MMTRMTRREECRCTVTLSEVGGTLDPPPEQEIHAARHRGYEVVEDWAGRPALAVDQAAEFATAWRREAEARSEKNFAYQGYLVQCAEKARDAVLEARRKAREESQQRTRKLREQEHEHLAHRAEEEAAERAQGRARHQGTPVSFEAFEG